MSGLEVKTSDPAPADGELSAHDQRMLDVADGKAKPGDPVPEPAPEWLPEKFVVRTEDGKVDVAASSQKMAESYRELESKGSKPKEGTEEPKEGTENPSRDAAADAVQSAGLDLSALETEFAEKGELSQESFDKLAKAGISKEVVDSYIAGQQALASQFEAAVHDVVGGTDTYAQMGEWAASNLSEAELNAYNSAVTGKSLEEARLAAQGLHARYVAAVGHQGRHVGAASGAPAPDSLAFRSWAEVKTAMTDPRYKSDPAYRSDVERRMARSSI